MEQPARPGIIGIRYVFATGPDIKPGVVENMAQFGLHVRVAAQCWVLPERFGEDVLRAPYYSLRPYLAARARECKEVPEDFGRLRYDGIVSFLSTGGFFYGVAPVSDSPRIILVAGENEPSETNRKLLAHETGHFISEPYGGLDHCPERQCTMSVADASIDGHNLVSFAGSNVFPVDRNSIDRHTGLCKRCEEKIWEL